MEVTSYPIYCLWPRATPSRLLENLQSQKNNKKMLRIPINILGKHLNRSGPRFRNRFFSHQKLKPKKWCIDRKSKKPCRNWRQNQRRKSTSQRLLTIWELGNGVISKKMGTKNRDYPKCRMAESRVKSMNKKESIHTKTQKDLKKEKKTKKRETIVKLWSKDRIDIVGFRNKEGNNDRSKDKGRDRERSSEIDWSKDSKRDESKDKDQHNEGSKDNNSDKNKESVNEGKEIANSANTNAKSVLTNKRKRKSATILKNSRKTKVLSLKMMKNKTGRKSSISW